MQTNKSREVQRFQRLALQRHEDALSLLRDDRNTASIYLAGYAVECGLKAVLLASHTAREIPGILESFRGNDGHNLESLRARYVKRSRANLPRSVAGAFALVGLWSTSLRYDPGLTSPREAGRFLAATEIVLDWMMGRI